MIRSAVVRRGTTMLLCATIGLLAGCTSTPSGPAPLTAIPVTLSEEQTQALIATADAAPSGGYTFAAAGDDSSLTTYAASSYIDQLRGDSRPDIAPASCANSIYDLALQHGVTETADSTIWVAASVVMQRDGRSVTVQQKVRRFASPAAATRFFGAYSKDIAACKRFTVTQPEGDLTVLQTVGTGRPAGSLTQRIVVEPKDGETTTSLMTLALIGNVMVAYRVLDVDASAPDASVRAAEAALVDRAKALVAAGPSAAPSATRTTDVDTSTQGLGSTGTLAALIPAAPTGLVYSAADTAGVNNGQFRELGLESSGGVLACDETFMPDTTDFFVARFRDADDKYRQAVSAFLYRLADPAAAKRQLAECAASPRGRKSVTTGSVDGQTVWSASPDTGPVSTAIVGDVLVFTSGSQNGPDDSSPLMRQIVARASHS